MNPVRAHVSCRALPLLIPCLLVVFTGGCGGGGGGSGSGMPPPTADTTPPSVPQGLAATALSATEIRLDWQPSTDAGTGVAGYRVFRNGGTAPVATVAGTTHTDAGLTPSTTYTYAVRAFDGATPANESAVSASVSATTAPASSPPPPTGTLGVERAFPNLPAFNSPVAVVQAPGDGSTWYVVEQQGRVRAFANQPSVSSSRTFVDISSRVRSGGETGLLGLTFHPGYPADPRAYLSYTNDSGTLVSRVSEFRSRDGGQTLDPNSEVVLITVTQPATNHNGGNVAFGPDGHLYIGLGDGGDAGDPWGDFGNGQNLRTLLGKMLRIDVDGTTGSVPYRIPSDNPFAGNPPCRNGNGTQECPEIYAYGFRNPWRWSFDREGGELWVGDVGQNTLEEIDRVVRGDNYGWRCFEGTRTFNANCGPNASSSQPPVAQYGRDAGISVTGGYVYRGTALASLVGRYVFADFGSGRIWHISRTTSPTLEVRASDALDTELRVSSFGEGADGELLIVDYRGTLHRLVLTTSSGAPTPAR
jgi:glucose/arabinose dehydrogenase